MGYVLNHLDIAELLYHVFGLVDTIVATTSKRKADGDKASLLSNILHEPSRADRLGHTTASSLSGSQAARGGATRGSVPSKYEC